MLLTILFALIGSAAGIWLTLKLGEAIDKMLEIGVSQTYGLDIGIFFWMPFAFCGVGMGAAMYIVSIVSGGTLPVWGALIAPTFGGAFVHLMFVVYALLYKLITGKTS